MTITSSSLWEWRKVQSLFLFPQRIGITNPACGVLNYSHKEMQICPISKKLDKNLDSESEAYRVFKQLIERLNRTFKHHVKPSHGFNSMNGAVALVTLFVTHYNFLRPHMSLQWQVPIPLKELEGITTLQGRWAKILSLAA